VSVIGKLKVHLLRRLGRPIIARTNRFGLLLVDDANWLSRAIWTGVDVEKDELDQFESVMDRLRPEIVVDAGANIGLYTLAACRLGAPEIVAFEPNPVVYTHLAGNVFLNGFADRVRLHECALGADDGEGDLFLCDRHAEVSTLRPSAMEKSFSYQRSRTVRVARFDSLYQWTGRRILIKVDVEGFEDQVLAGMAQLLERNQIVLMVEIFQSDSPAFAMLQALGYAKTGQFGRNFWFEKAGLSSSEISEQIGAR